MRARLPGADGFHQALPSCPRGQRLGGHAGGLYRKVGSVDFGFVPGRGVFGHPMGPRGGAASIRQAWDAIAQGIPVAQHAAAHAELRAALEAFGGRG